MCDEFARGVYSARTTIFRRSKLVASLIFVDDDGGVVKIDVVFVEC